MTGDALRGLVLAHEPFGGACEVEARLVTRGVEVSTHYVTDDFEQPDRAAPFPDTDGFDLILPMGSIRSLTNKVEIDSWIHDELRLLLDAHDRGTPMLGVCFGGQLLAEALGGSVERAPIPEIGWYEISPANGVENPAGRGPWLQWHHDRFAPPPGAEVLAVSDEAVQLFRLGASVGTQFHPEVNVGHVCDWLAQADDAYLDGIGVSRAEMAAETMANEAKSIAGCIRLVDWFLDEVATPALARRT